MSFSAKKGRPRKYEKPLYFGMKVTAEEKNKIHTLAHLTGTTATQAIITLVENAINHLEQSSGPRLTVDELLALPKAKRLQLIAIQAKQAAQDYEIIEDVDDIVDG